MYDYYEYGSSGGSTFSTILSLLMCAISIASMWKIFIKAGEPGWAAIIPFYNIYVLFKITWGKGIKCLFMLIPLANIVFSIITCAKLSKAFGKGGGFTVGLVLLGFVFMPILAFGNARYLGVEGAAAAGAYTYASANTGANSGAGYAPTGERYRPQAEQPAYQPTQNYQQPTYQQPTYQAAAAPVYQQAAPEAEKPNSAASNMWRCTCGVQCTGAFCHNCGAAKPEAPAAEEAPQTAFCHNCGKKVESGSAFCPDCGTKLG